MGLQLDAIIHGNNLKKYFDDKGLPPQFLESPEDIVYMPETLKEFEEQLEKLPTEEVYIRQEDRFNVIAKMGGRLSVGTWGRLKWVEVIEPTEVEVSLGWTGVQFLRFYYPSLEAARGILKTRGVDHLMQEGQFNDELVLIYDRNGSEVRFTNKPTAYTLSRELETGTARPLAA